MKTCFKCGESKPLSEFYRHDYMADGHLNKCKACTKRDAWTHRRDNIEKVRAYDRERGRDPRRIAETARRTQEYRERYPERWAANIAVGNAVRDGKLQREPCWTCGTMRRLEAHHPDYSRPLSVVWLCAAHHRELHLAYPEDHYHNRTGT